MWAEAVVPARDGTIAILASHYSTIPPSHDGVRPIVIIEGVAYGLWLMAYGR